MKKRSSQGFIVRVQEAPLEILVQNLRTGENRTFASWEELLGYLQMNLNQPSLK